MTLSANAGRPLFVPSGIQAVRTGPTTRAEFERLLVDDELEHSGVRLIPRRRARGLLNVVAEILQLTSQTPRSPRGFESR